MTTDNHSHESAADGSEGAAKPVLSNFDPVPALAEELSLPRSGVSAVVKLLVEGATVPFIARYRKEATGGLDEVQIRTIEERHGYLKELEERRAVVLAEIGRQGKLTPDLEKKIREVKLKADLEDLYLPYKPKKRTRAIIARERGLEPLADRLWSQPSDGKPDEEAKAFVNAAKEVPDVFAALSGARDICAERIAEHDQIRKLVRETFTKEGKVVCIKNEDFKEKVTKFDMYAAFEEPIANIPSHRYLAIRRGETEGVLRANLTIEEAQQVPRIEAIAGVKPSSPWAPELRKAAADATKRLLLPTIQSDVRVDMKMVADRGAVDVFAQNLRELLLSAPYGTKRVLGIDPGQRTGCKCVVIDDTGKLLEHETIYLVQGDSALAKGKRAIVDLCKKHNIVAVAVGNGTHGRETESFARESLTEAGMKDVLVVSVSEAGASVYSASDVAREEFPELDVSIRGAISIARRLQDPLAELVKIDPKSIGVGQYQHDVYQGLLAKKLDDVVESCVSSVGVELNTASAPLLSRVAGIGPSMAKKIVAHRNAAGAFRSRKALLDVSGLGPKTFEQCAGFVRVRGGEHPLDSSAVHPERYSLVERIAKDLGVPVASLVGDMKLIDRIDPKRYLDGDVGIFTMNDILSELKKPGRDPRATFEPPKFRDDVRTMEDLKLGMDLEGVVTNVTAFGAFVDIGVHQDGLVHVSKLSDRFVKDPSEVVKVGDKIRVRVMEVDLARKRISLSAKKGDMPDGSNVPGATGAQVRKEPVRKEQGGSGRTHDFRSQGGQSGSQKKPDANAAGFKNNPFEKLLKR